MTITLARKDGLVLEDELSSADAQHRWHIDYSIFIGDSARVADIVSSHIADQKVWCGFMYVLCITVRAERCISPGTVGIALQSWESDYVIHMLDALEHFTQVSFRCC